MQADVDQLESELLELLNLCYFLLGVGTFEDFGFLGGGGGGRLGVDARALLKLLVLALEAVDDGLEDGH